MFGKRIRKKYPANLFIPTPVRIVVILMLCLVFSLILIRMSDPFMGELFSNKSKKILFHFVMGVPQGGSSELLSTEQQPDNAQRFAALPLGDQHFLNEEYAKLQQQSSRSFLDKLGQSFHLLIFDLPLFERAWIALALTISIFLLLRIEGTLYAVWLLPVVTLCYVLNNGWFAPPHELSAEAKLFPSEKEIVKNHLKQPLKRDIEEQRLQLLDGWKQYLVVHWAHQEPSSDAQTFNKQVSEGEFAFNLARLKTVLSEKQVTPGTGRESTFLLCLYFFGNLLFALFVSRKLRSINK